MASTAFLATASAVAGDPGLAVGSAGYVLNAFVGYGIVDAESWLVEGLTYLATVGQFWMIGYLLILGIRPPTAMG